MRGVQASPASSTTATETAPHAAMCLASGRERRSWRSESLKIRNQKNFQETQFSNFSKNSLARGPRRRQNLKRTTLLLRPPTPLLQPCKQELPSHRYLPYRSLAATPPRVETQTNRPGGREIERKKLIVRTPLGAAGWAKSRKSALSRKSS